MKILGMGWPELIIIIVIILLIFGPKQLPKLGRAIGKTFKNLKKGINGDDEENATQEGEVAQAEAETPEKPKKTEALPAATTASTPYAPAPAQDNAQASATAPEPASTTTPHVVKKTVVKKKVE